MRVAWFLVAVTGCYAPAGYRDCEISCAASGQCPDGFACLTDGLCHARGSTICGEPPDDAGPGSCVKLHLSGREYCPPAPVAAVRTLDSAGGLGTDGPSCDDVLPQSTGPQICVIAGRTVQVTAPVRPQGRRPLLIVALEDIVVAQPIDVSTGGAGDASPPDPAVPCVGVGMAALAIAGTSGGAGGGGGGFATAGGAGGAIVNGQPTSGGAVIASPDILRAGCPGGESGGDDDLDNPAPGGRPGGALYLAAGRRIEVNANLHAWGGGGIGGGTGPVGGGGGGSGGMIVLDSDQITIAVGVGVLAAGAGGGEGHSAMVQSAAMTGQMQDPAMPTVAAKGGAGLGRRGGDGSGTTPGKMVGEVAAITAGAGGGGGGAGYIRVFGTLTNDGVIHPPAVP